MMMAAVGLESGNRRMFQARVKGGFEGGEAAATKRASSSKKDGLRGVQIRLH